MRLIASALMLIIGSGCAVPMDDVTGNEFSEAVPKPVNKSYVGMWTGTNGSDLITLRIDEDGRGVSCSSRAGQDAINKLKISENTLYFQDGTSMVLTYADGYINGSSLRAGSQNMRFIQDGGLVGASPYCRDVLQKPYL